MKEYPDELNQGRRDFAAEFDKEGRKDLADLFLYIWSRVQPALSDKEERTLATILSMGDPKISDIKKIMAEEDRIGKEKVGLLVEKFRLDLKAISEQE